MPPCSLTNLVKGSIASACTSAARGFPTMTARPVRIFPSFALTLASVLLAMFSLLTESIIYQRIRIHPHTSIDGGSPDPGAALMTDCQDKNAVARAAESWKEWITDGSIDAWFATDGGEREYFTGDKAVPFFASSALADARVTKAIWRPKNVLTWDLAGNIGSGIFAA